MMHFKKNIEKAWQKIYNRCISCELPTEGRAERDEISNAKGGTHDKKWKSDAALMGQIIKSKGG